MELHGLKRELYALNVRIIVSSKKNEKIKKRQ